MPEQYGSRPLHEIQTSKSGILARREPHTNSVRSQVQVVLPNRKTSLSGTLPFVSDNHSVPRDPNDSVSLPPPPPRGPSVYNVETAKVSRLEVIAKIALAVALVGSFMPWARVLFFTVNGTDGDGVITAIASGIALALIFAGERRVDAGRNPFRMFAWSAVCASLAALVYSYDFVNLSSLSDEASDSTFEVSVQPQIGLILGMLGAIVSAVVCIQLALRNRDRKSTL